MFVTTNCFHCKDYNHRLKNRFCTRITEANCCKNITTRVSFLCIPKCPIDMRYHKLALSSILCECLYERRKTAAM